MYSNVKVMHLWHLGFYGLVVGLKFMIFMIILDFQFFINETDKLFLN